MKKPILFIWLSLLASTLFAQTTTSYYCDFEDPAENAQWVLNAGARGTTSKNHWYLGAAGSFGVGSTQGLYTADTANISVCGYTANNFSCFQSSYRELTLQRGTYTIQFDWKGLGQTNDELIVFWVPSTQSVASSWSATDQALPTGWNGYNKAIHLRGKANWQSYSGTLDVASNGGKLVVMWYNKKGVATIPGGAIDNIRIYQGTPCTGPTTLSYNIKTGTLAWNGNAQNHDVLVYNFQTNDFGVFQNVPGTSMTVTGMANEGMYYFYVRANCGDSLHCSDWVSCSQFVWIPGARCLDFMDLDGAKCYRGPFDDVTGGTGHSMGKVDYGYESVKSFHTLHYVPGELDPRTNNKLTTVPQGEVASVRLGNWKADGAIDGQGAGEAIEYKYLVKAGQSDIMEINYAVVMEKPGHNDGTDPHFLLEILDQQGKQIGGAQVACYKADFAASSDNPAALRGWNELQPAQLTGVEGVSSTPIIWKPWTLISVSLRNYVGQTLTIRFTTMDCRQYYHWAYAYFTIGCRSGDLQGIACGDYSTDHFDAPEGFDYRWYWEGDPSRILGTDSRFDITPTTDSVYVVDVISKTAGGCYYSLTANPNPRFPKAHGYILDQRPRNCENRVVIKNESRVHFIDRKTGDEMITQETEPVEAMFWHWGDGSTVEENTNENVPHVFPATGGTFRVMAVASMSGGICTDTVYFDITLPDITTAGSTDEVNLCRAETPVYRKDGYVITKDTTYYTYVQNQYDCDVPLEHHVFFHDSVLSVKDTSFCEGGYIVFEGKKYSETGIYRVPYKTVFGCDSTLVLDLTVIPQLEIAVDSVARVCGDGVLTIPFDIIKGRYNGMRVHMGEGVFEFGANDPIEIPMYDPETHAFKRPGLYDVMLELGTPDCPAPPVYIKADVLYAPAVIYQKHGFIGLYNAENNGYGEDFSGCTYRWYCNGELIPGAESAYIHVNDGDYMKEYSVEIIRPNGEAILSCPITYTYMMVGLENSDADSQVVGYYDMLGRRSSVLPTHPGVYMVVLKDHTEKIVVR